MKFRRRYPRFTRFSALLPISLAVLILFAGEAVAFLHRVGPLNPAPPVGNFPAWYQDNTGLTLEFCNPLTASEVNGGWCLLLPGDVTIPEVFPTNFFDEHFYFAAGADPILEPGGASSSLQFARLVLAVESAFSTGNAVPGAQIVFARIRVDFRDTPVAGTYRFIHPYGEEIVDALAGVRIFLTDDIGIACPPGDFSCALGSRLGPFLLPSNTPGGAEMAPLTEANPTPDTDPAHFGGVFAPTAWPHPPGTDNAYIADPARLGPVTGSPLPNFIACPSSAPCTLGTGGTSRNHNIWRVEGPPGSNLDGLGHSFIETDNLTLVGRIFTGAIPGEVTVNRAEYARNVSGQKVEVYATGLETTQGRLPASPLPPAVLPQLSFFDAPCGLATDNTTYIAPVGATETQMFHAGNNFWAQVQPTAIPVAVCVKDNVSLTYFPKAVVDEITITQAYFDPNAPSLSVQAHSSDEITPPVLSLGELGDLVNGSILVSPLAAPPSHVHLNSSAGGSRTQEVTTNGGILPATGVTLQAAPGSPQLAGTPVAFIAAGQGGTGVYEYKFSDNVTGTMIEKQPYSTSPVLVWPTTVPVGSYAIRVDAKSSGSPSLSETDNTIAYTLTIPPPATGVSLFAAPASPQPAGSHVAFLATGQGGTGVYEYQFSDNVTGSMAVTQPYSSTAGWVWNTTGFDNGTYAIRVDVRSGPAGPSETDNTVNFIIAPLPVAVTLEPSLAGPQAPGSQIVWIANGAGGSGTYEYLYLYQTPAGTWLEGQVYSRSSTWTWNTSGLAAGTYNFQVWIRNLGSGAPYENWTGGTYTLNSGLPPVPPNNVSLGASPPTVVGGDNVDLIAVASGGTGPYEYMFLLQNPSGTWSEGRAYLADGGTWRWTTPVGAPGTYNIQVWTRNINSPAPYETWRGISFVLQ